MTTSRPRFTTITLLALAGVALAVVAPGCTAETPEGGDEDYSDATWDALSTDNTGDAVLENASAEEDAADPPEDLDETNDAAEPDDVDDEQEPDSVANAAADPTDDGASPASLGILAGKPGRPTYQNSVLANCADPGVISVGGQFIAACTGGGYPTFTSPDLVHWTPGKHIFTTANRPKWVGKNWWAPEIHHIGAAYVAYFSAFSPKRNEMCIGAARGRTATGPWTDIGKPLVCDKGVGLIDVNAFTDGQGRHFLYYKTEGNALRPQKRTIIFGHQLGADGVSFVGKRHRMLKNTLGWEGDVIEAPWVIARGGYTYMFYSGFRYCNGTYGVGVARARSPLGPFHKKGGPVLRSNAGWSGPGHNSVVRANGHDFIVYHAWKGAHQCGQGGGRHLLVDRISWKGGWPAISNGTPGRGRHTAPLAQ